MENTERSARAVARDERLLFGVGYLAGKFDGDVAFKIESGIVEKLLGDLNERRQLVRGDRLLCECIRCFGDLLLLRNPRSLAFAAGDRYSMSAA